MARKPDDAIAPAGQPLTDQQVAEYLRRNPDFLLRHPNLLSALAPPSRFPDAGSVVDMQVFMIERLRDEVDNVKGAAEHLIHTSRSNMTTQDRTHRAALVLLAAESMEALAQAIADDLPPLLDVDVATLCFEETDAPLEALAVPGILRIKAGSAEIILGGTDRNCALAEAMPGDPALFAEAATLVHSSAAVRLSPGGPYPEGLLCLGSRDGRTFHAGQATDLLAFLSRVLEICIRRVSG